MAEQIDDDNTVHGVEDNTELLKISELTVQSQTILISLYNLRVNIKNIETNFRNYERESIKFIRQPPLIPTTTPSKTTKLLAPFKPMGP